MNRLKRQATILGGFIITIWLLELIDSIFLHQALNTFGVWPRRLRGLWGILFMPLLHGSLAHVAANTMPFLVLGWLVMLRRLSDFIVVTTVTMLVTGAGIWFFGASRSVYIGASGLIFGYFGFLLFRGYFKRSLQSLLVTLVVIILYGGLLWGVVPQRNGISWEVHLLGFVGGALCARLLVRLEVQESPADESLSVFVDET
jgi:membrane associated rhomboid family serine protease